MRLVYVFDVRESDGYICRVPVLLARVMCMAHDRLSSRTLDYASTPEGE